MEVVMDQKINGHAVEKLEEEFFQTTESPKTAKQELDLDEYRSGKALDLANITSLPDSQRVDTRRPRKKEWFRCYSMADLQRVWIYEGDGINEIYLVRKDVALEMPDEFVEAYLVLCINSAGRLFLWPIKCSEGGQDFTEAALQHVSRARSSWIRRKWINRSATFKVEASTLDGIEPEWPQDIEMRNIISKAFADRVIRSIDHPCLRFARSAE
jgi:hypothetical protein